MDLKKWFSNNKWIVLVLIYLVAIFFQYKSNGLSFLTTSGGIGLMVALVSTVFAYNRSLKKLLRKIKYFMGFGMFQWNAKATFLVRYSDFSTIKNQEEKIKTLLLKALKENGIDADKKSIDPSYGKNNNLKLMIKKYIVQLDISISDAEMVDDEDFALGWVSLEAIASLRYKDSNKAINCILVDFYNLFENEYKSKENKYEVVIEPETIEKNFMKKHFINEYTSDEVSKFSIMCKNGTKSVITTNEKNITLVTNRKEELQNFVKNAIIRLA